MTDTALTRVASLASLTLVLVLAVPEARADRRAFTHTYEYMTMPKGDLELEFYSTQESATFDTDSPTAYEWQIETEYGITNHWDVSLYQVFEAVDGGNAAPDASEPLHPSKTKLRTRYRLAERGQWPVDVLLYFEIIKPFGVAMVGFEPKLILARDFGKLTAVVNLIAELEPEEETDAATLETEVEMELEYGWAAGITYEVAPALKLGVENWGAVHHGELEGVYAGPAISWAPSPKLWITGTTAFGLNDDSADLSFRFILGLSL